MTTTKRMIQCCANPKTIQSRHHRHYYCPAFQGPHAWFPEQQQQQQQQSLAVKPTKRYQSPPLRLLLVPMKGCYDSKQKLRFFGSTMTRWSSTSSGDEMVESPSVLSSSLVRKLLQSSSSKLILNQDDSESTKEELTLKRILERLRDDRDINSTRKEGEEEQDGNNNDELLQLREELFNAYMDLEYWDEALQVEQSKYPEKQPPVLTTSDTDEYAESIHTQGKLLVRLEDYSAAKPLYQQLLDYYTYHQNEAQQGHVLISLAGWHFFQNQLEKAMERLHESESLVESNPILLVKSLDNQALIYRLWQDYDASLEKYQQALEILGDEMKDLSTNETRRTLLLHIADMHMALDDVDPALELYQNLLLETSNPALQGVLHHNIAMVHVKQGQFDLAIQGFHQALEFKQQAGGEHNQEVGKTWMALGKLHANTSSPKAQALECFRQALIIARIHAEGPLETDPFVQQVLKAISSLREEEES